MTKGEATSVPLLSRALQEDGLKLTKSRRTILKAVAASSGPFTSAELCEAASSLDGGIGRASVFRVLQLLRQRGLVERLHSDDDERYTLCLETTHHHHATCLSCGRTDPLRADDAERALTRAVEALGYVPSEHVLEARGICPACQDRDRKVPRGERE